MGTVTTSTCAFLGEGRLPPQLIGMQGFHEIVRAGVWKRHYDARTRCNSINLCVESEGLCQEEREPAFSLAVKHSETSTGGPRNAGCMTAHRQQDLSPSSSLGAEHKEKEHIREM